MNILSWILFPSLFFLFILFFKIGLVFFGGGYVIIPVLHRELVSNLHLLTEQQFIDGVAISQLTPGPVAILATFVGYCISGVAGALIATFAMFLPGASLMILLSKSYKNIKDSKFVYKALATIIPVIAGLLVATSIQLGLVNLKTPISLIILVVSFLMIIKYRVNPAILIICMAVAGLFAKY